MYKIRILPLVGVIGLVLSVIYVGVVRSTTYAVPVNAADNASQKSQEKSNERSDTAGWMQSGKVYASEDSKAGNVAAMQICEQRQPVIHKKIETIVVHADTYEQKLTKVYAQILRLREDSNVTSPEIDSLVMAAQSIKESKVVPLLSELTQYESNKKVSCDAGVASVVSTLIHVQSTTDQLREALAEYRNSIKALLFAVRDNSKGTTS